VQLTGVNMNTSGKSKRIELPANSTILD